MARRTPNLLRLSGAALLVAGAAACSQPQVAELAETPSPVAEAPPVLLGADPSQADLQTSDPTSAPALAEARRPGWGTMEPIPNPPSGYAAADRPAYRLVGPTVSEPPVRQARRQPAPAMRVAARLKPAPAAGRPRIQHIIMPGSRPRPS